jgi:CheY-like chemotaxis protein
MPVEHAADGREALERLDGVAVVLLDRQLPDATGMEVLDAIRARPHPPAVVMITAHGSEALAAAALRQGADDYLVKDVSLGRMLPQVLERVRRSRELRKALAAAQRDLLRAERLAAVGEMTVTLHHEINNPLMSAFADVELLLADPALAEDRRREGLLGIQTRPPDLRHRPPDRRAPGGPNQDLRRGHTDGGPRVFRRCRAPAEPGPGGRPAGGGRSHPGGLVAAPPRRLRGGGGGGHGRPARPLGGSGGAAGGGERGQRRGGRPSARWVRAG